MQDKFIVSHNGFEVGPLRIEEIRLKLAKDEFQPVDYVYIDEKQDWIMLAELQSYLDSEKKGPMKDAVPLERAESSHAPYPEVPESQRTGIALKTSSLDLPPQVISLPLTQTAKSPVKSIEVTSAPLENNSSALPKKETPSKELHFPKDSSSTQNAPSAPEQKKSFTLQSGEGSYSLEAHQAGQFQVTLKSKDGKNLKSDSPLQLKISSGRVAAIDWRGPQSLTVGETAHFQFFAKDKFGNLVQDFSSTLTLEWQGDVEGPGNFSFQNGKADLHFTSKKAHSLKFQLQVPMDYKDIQVPSAGEIRFEAGPAERLILDGPTEVTAGEPIQVKVRAVDQFGNLAPLNTEVELEVSSKTS